MQVTPRLIGPAEGSVHAGTGAGDIHVILDGDMPNRTVDIHSGNGNNTPAKRRATAFSGGRWSFLRALGIVEPDAVSGGGPVSGADGYEVLVGTGTSLASGAMTSATCL